MRPSPSSVLPGPDRPPRALAAALAGALLVAISAVTLGGQSEPGADMERNALPPPPPAHQKLPQALFSDNFQDGKLDGWTADQPGVWVISHGLLRADLPDGRQLRSFIYAGSESWTDVAVDLDVCAMRGVDKGVAVRVTGKQGIGIDLRGPGYQDLVVYRRDWPMGRASVVNANAVWHHIRVEARAHHYRVWVNRELLIDREDPHKAYPAGQIALPAYTGGTGKCTVYYDNVVVTPLP